MLIDGAERCGLRKTTAEMSVSAFETIVPECIQEYAIPRAADVPEIHEAKIHEEPYDHFRQA